MLLARLERVPADSVWAHRASGLRGALLDALEAVPPPSMQAMDRLTRQAFRILEGAAEEKSRPFLKAGVARRRGDRRWFS